MTVTARQLNRATLARQLILERTTVDAPTAVRRIVAIQAQEPASPYVALWNRVGGFRAAELDADIEAYRVVKATLMRATLHAVHVDDHASFHNAMEPILRASRLADGRFTVGGLSVADVDALLPEFLEFVASPRSVAEIEAMLERRNGPAKTQLWWALRTFAPLFHVPTGGLWSFGARRRSYRAAGSTLGADDRLASTQHLIRRYLGGFGPATVQDISRFTLMSVARVRDALRGIDEELVRLDGPDGVALVDIQGAAIPDEVTPAPPRLMAMWDSSLLAYADRRRIIPEDYRRHVIRSNGDVLPTILVDGYVAGVWRPKDGAIEVTAFESLSKAAWRGLTTEADALREFLRDRQSNVYGRYGRWWAALPNAEIRRVP